MEQQLLCNLIHWESFQDDSVMTPYFPVRYDTWFHLFGHKAKAVHAEGSVGHRFEYIVHDLEDDYHLLGKSTYGVNKAESEEFKQLADDTFGDILPTRWTMNCLAAVPTQRIIELMGLEQFIFSMYDYPDLLKELMMRAADDYLEYFHWLENQHLLLPTVGPEFLGQGTYCFSTELPAQSANLKVGDVWGYMNSQETSSVSPEMYGEFIYPSYRKIADAFGLLSYGCCEATDPIWEQYLSKLPRLRNVSVSPWCNQEYMGEQLRGKKVIFHRKPNANFLSLDPELNETGFREHIRHTLKAAKGCQLEFTQRDLLTIHNNEKKVARYVEIVRDEIERCWE